MPSMRTWVEKEEKVMDNTTGLAVAEDQVAVVSTEEDRAAHERDIKVGVKKPV